MTIIIITTISVLCFLSQVQVYNRLPGSEWCRAGPEDRRCRYGTQEEVRGLVPRSQWDYRENRSFPSLLCPITAFQSACSTCQTNRFTKTTELNTVFQFVCYFYVYDSSNYLYSRYIPDISSASVSYLKFQFCYSLDKFIVLSCFHFLPFWISYRSHWPCYIGSKARKRW